jgi:F-type H+-transporting ATPase subunit delta
MEALSRRLAKVSPQALNFVHLLIEQDRTELVEQVVSEYERLLDAYYLGVEYVEVTTAIPLEEEQKERIIRRLAELRGKQVRLSTQIDPSILGGMIIRIGDRVIDGSVRNRLIELKQSLGGGIRSQER